MTKKFSWIILILLVVLSGCSSKSDTSEIKYLENATVGFVYHENTAEHAIAFQVTNQGEQKISEFMVALVAYDASGNILLASNPIRNVKVSSADLNSGFSKIYRVSDSGIEDAKYFRAVISSITYSDALEETFDDLQRWGELQSTTLNVTSEMSELTAKFTEIKTAAEANTNLEILSVEQKTLDYNLQNQAITIKVKNNSEEKVTSFKLLFAFFDSEGNPLSAGESAEIYVKNAKLLPYDGVVGANLESGVLRAEDFFPVNTASFAYVVLEVNYDSGTQWRNENATGWAVYQSRIYE